MAGKKNLRKVVGKGAIPNASLFNLAFLGNLKRMKCDLMHISLTQNNFISLIMIFNTYQ